MPHQTTGTFARLSPRAQSLPPPSCAPARHTHLESGSHQGPRRAPRAPLGDPRPMNLAATQPAATHHTNFGALLAKS